MYSVDLVYILHIVCSSYHINLSCTYQTINLFLYSKIIKPSLKNYISEDLTIIRAKLSYILLIIILLPLIPISLLCNTNIYPCHNIQPCYSVLIVNNPGLNTSFNSWKNAWPIFGFNKISILNLFVRQWVTLDYSQARRLPLFWG